MTRVSSSKVDVILSVINRCTDCPVRRKPGWLLRGVLALWTLPVQDPEVPHRPGGVLLRGDTGGSLVLLQGSAAVWTGAQHVRGGGGGGEQ